VERDGNLNIQVDLLDTSNGSELWGHQYSQKLSDILSVQEEIAREISGKLLVKLSGEEQTRLVKRSTENPEAYQLYLKGTYHWNRRTAEDLKKCIEYLDQAIALDPTYALAYAGLAGCYNVMPQYAGTPSKECYPQAEQAARRAIQIDDAIAPAHAFLGYARFVYDLDWAGAEREFRRAIALDANFVSAHSYYAGYLVAMGRFEEAIAEARRGQKLEPLSLITHATAGLVLVHARRYDDAIAQARKALDLDPNFAAGHWYLGMAYEAKGVHDVAIEEFQKTIDLVGKNPEYLASLAAAFASSGRTAEARKILAAAPDRPGDGYLSAYGRMWIHTNLGEKDRALDFLEKAYEDRAFQISMIKTQPIVDPLRSEPRFAALLRRMNFPP